MIGGVRHYAYVRGFNNGSWLAGGRLYSIGPDTYQQLPEHERYNITLHDEQVAEIDIKASHLIIYSITPSCRCPSTPLPIPTSASG
jgi:hypothetical protein